jgi:hypothetical protein
MASKKNQVDDSHLETKEQESVCPNSAINSTVLADAAVQWMHVGTVTSASNADSKDIAKIAALSRIDTIYGMCSKYLRYNLWSNKEEETNNITTTPYCLADWTEHAKPPPQYPKTGYLMLKSWRQSRTIQIYSKSSPQKM